MDWLRASINIVLACLTSTQGVLSIIAYTRVHEVRFLVLAVSSFVFAVAMVARVSMPQAIQALYVTLWLTNVVLMAFFFASIITLADWLLAPSDPAAVMGIPYHIAPVTLSLAFATMFFMGVLITLELLGLTAHNHGNVVADSEAKVSVDVAGWHSGNSEVLRVSSSSQMTSHGDQLSLNKAHTVDVPPPIVHLELDHNSLGGSTLNNKDSNGTLVVPIMSREHDPDDCSLQWLIRASVSSAGLYDNPTENWMNSRSSVDHHEAWTKSIASQSRITRSNTTGIFPGESRTRMSFGSISSNTTDQKINPSNSMPMLEISKARKFSKNKTAGSLSPNRPEIISESSIDNSFEGGEKGNATSNAAFRCSPQGTPRHKKAPRSLDNSEPQPDHVFSSSFNTSFNLKMANRPFAQNSSQPASPSDTSFVVNSNGPFEATHSRNERSTGTSSSGTEVMEGLEQIPAVASAWSISEFVAKNKHTNGGNMRSVSLQDWEANKGQWLSIHSENTPIVVGSGSTIDRKSTCSTSRLSAPSLHTYRDAGDIASTHSANTFSTSENTLYRCITPPQQQFQIPSEVGAPESSPIRKMIGRFKRKDSMSDNRTTPVAQKHKHSTSIANSMISVASGMSSRSGSPRKAIKHLFSRASLEQPVKKPSFVYSGHSTHSGHSANSAHSTFPDWNAKSQSGTAAANSIMHPMLSAEPFWDVETGEYSDKSRVSSVPSAVIGEYDREKWRTMQELRKNSEI